MEVVTSLREEGELLKLNCLNTLTEKSQGEKNKNKTKGKEIKQKNKLTFQVVLALLI